MKPADGTTVIGKSVKVKGELSGNEDLYMDGDVEGAITLLDSSLTIGPNAHIQADIRARDITILGNLKGNIYASGKVDLRHSAVVNGDIWGGRLSIEENAQLRGKVELRGEQQGQAGIESSTTKSKQEPFVLEPKA